MAPARTRPAARPWVGGRVLVIDDDVDEREALCELLTKSGYRVERAMDGLDGIELALSQPFDAVVVDVAMPRLNGFEVARQIFADPRTRGLPLIAVTARTVSPSSVLGGGPFREVFFKPIDTRAFMAYLRRLTEDAT